jgi:DNA polymerase-3 subunit gamma/tau
VQEEDIRETRNELLSYLKDKLNNSFIDLNVVMTEKAPESERAYTTRDKFKKMAEKNPDLEKLRQQFDLDLDY